MYCFPLVVRNSNKMFFFKELIKSFWFWLSFPSFFYCGLISGRMLASPMASIINVAMKSATKRP